LAFQSGKKNQDIRIALKQAEILHLKQAEADMKQVISTSQSRIDSLLRVSRKLDKQLQQQIRLRMQAEAALKAKQNEVHIADSVYLIAPDSGKDSLFRAIIR
jgi:hypothetical protein